MMSEKQIVEEANQAWTVPILLVMWKCRPRLSGAEMKGEERMLVEEGCQGGALWMESVAGMSVGVLWH